MSSTYGRNIASIGRIRNTEPQITASMYRGEYPQAPVSNPEILDVLQGVSTVVQNPEILLRVSIILAV